MGKKIIKENYVLKEETFDEWMGSKGRAKKRCVMKEIREFRLAPGRCASADAVGLVLEKRVPKIYVNAISHNPISEKRDKGESCRNERRGENRRALEFRGE